MKCFLLVILFVILVTTLYTTSYFFIEIRPHLEEIKQKSEPYLGKDANQEIMASIVFTQEGKAGILRYVAHLNAVGNIDNGFHGFWHFRGFHWQLWLRVLYSDQEIYQFWLAQIPYGPGRGMKEASLYHFDKEFEELSCYQLAQLVVMTVGPRSFAPGKKRSEKRIRDRKMAEICGS